MSSIREHSRLEVYEVDDGAFVATQQDGELEALGYSHAEGIANYARAVDNPFGVTVSVTGGPSR